MSGRAGQNDRMAMIVFVMCRILRDLWSSFCQLREIARHFPVPAWGSLVEAYVRGNNVARPNGPVLQEVPQLWPMKRYREICARRIPQRLAAIGADTTWYVDRDDAGTPHAGDPSDAFQDFGQVSAGWPRCTCSENGIDN
jgi:hypothetical protein